MGEQVASAMKPRYASRFAATLAATMAGIDGTIQDRTVSHLRHWLDKRYSSRRRGTLQDALEGTVKAEIAGSKPVGRADVGAGRRAGVRLLEAR